MAMAIRPKADYLTTKEIALALDVTQSAVWGWVRNGILKAVNYDSANQDRLFGHRQETLWIERAEFDRFLRAKEQATITAIQQARETVDQILAKAS